MFLGAATISARGQLSGTLSFGAQATNNVQDLDTIAPDHILLPAFELDYDMHPSGVSTITLTGSLSPEYYALNTGLSYNETSFGAIGVFYLSNQSAIAAEQASETSELNLLPISSANFEKGFMLRGVNTTYEHPRRDEESRDDSLVDLAESALYTLSGELDSTDISPAGILAHPR